MQLLWDIKSCGTCSLADANFPLVYAIPRFVPELIVGQVVHLSLEKMISGFLKHGYSFFPTFNLLEVVQGVVLNVSRTVSQLIIIQQKTFDDNLPKVVYVHYVDQVKNDLDTPLTLKISDQLTFVGGQAVVLIQSSD